MRGTDTVSLRPRLLLRFSWTIQANVRRLKCFELHCGYILVDLLFSSRIIESLISGLRTSDFKFWYHAHIIRLIVCHFFHFQFAVIRFCFLFSFNNPKTVRNCLLKRPIQISRQTVDSTTGLFEMFFFYRFIDFN